MKRFVKAAVISATLAAAAVIPTSCTWMEDYFKTGTGKTEEPEIPLDEVLSIEELLAGSFVGDTVWVRGHIVGGLSSDGVIDIGCQGSVVANALIIADEADCTEPDDCIVLQLTKKAHREALAPDNPANREKILYQTIFVQGKVTTYKRIPALTNLCQYKLE
ncbi:MAG: hypothetical protein II002_03075 [Bacteroidales bacterium]|nr:hypothetical protein [Bacteroidales bacterium]